MRRTGRRKCVSYFRSVSNFSLHRCKTSLKKNDAGFLELTNICVVCKVLCGMSVFFLSKYIACRGVKKFVMYPLYDSLYRNKIKMH